MYISFFQVIKDEVLEDLITNKSNKGGFAFLIPLGAVLLFFLKKCSGELSLRLVLKYVYLSPYKRIRK